MSKKANPTVVGAFVLAAVALTVATVITLGNFKFKDNRFRTIAFFAGSLYGLDIGAPVTFHGVTIGRVTEIRIHFDKEQNTYIIPVYIDIEQTASLESNLGKTRDAAALRKMMEKLIDRGLRAQLKISSLLTSKLYIDLAFYPNTVPQLHSSNGDLIEIPTLPSGLEQFAQKMESLPLADIINKTVTALDGINRILNASETRHSLQALDSTLARLDTLVNHADAEFPALAAELKKGLGNFSTLAATANNLLRTADKDLPPISHDLQQVLASLNGTSLALTKTLNNIEQITAKDSTFSYQVSSSLQEIEKAAASLRQLTEYLQQNPNALVFGQGEDKP